MDANADPSIKANDFSAIEEAKDIGNTHLVKYLQPACTMSPKTGSLFVSG